MISERNFVVHRDYLRLHCRPHEMPKLWCRHTATINGRESTSLSPPTSNVASRLPASSKCKEDGHLGRCDNLRQVVQNVGANSSQPVPFKARPLVAKQDAFFTQTKKPVRVIDELLQQQSGGDGFITGLLATSFMTRCMA